MGCARRVPRCYVDGDRSEIWIESGASAVFFNKKREQGWTRDDFIAGRIGARYLNDEERGQLWGALEDYDRALEEYERRKALAEEPTTHVTLYPRRVTLVDIAERFGVIPSAIRYWKKKREQGWTRDDFLNGFRTTGTDIFQLFIFPKGCDACRRGVRAISMRHQSSQSMYVHAWTCYLLLDE